MNDPEFNQTAAELAAKWRADAGQYKTWANLGGGPRPGSMLSGEADGLLQAEKELRAAFGIPEPHDQPNMFVERWMADYEAGMSWRRTQLLHP